MIIEVLCRKSVLQALTDGQYYFAVCVNELAQVMCMFMVSERG